MSTKLYLILSAALICAFMAMIYFATSSRVEQVNRKPTSEQTDHTTIPHKKNSAAINCPQKIETRSKPSTEKLDVSNEKSLTILNLWYNLNNHPEKLTVSIDPRIKNVQKVGVNTRIISILEATDTIQLPLIDGEKYLLQIKNISKRKNVDMEIYGEIDYRGSVYSSTITLVDHSLYALLSTPSGDYDLRMADDKGYLYKSGQLEGNRGLKTAESIIDLPSFLD